MAKILFPTDFSETANNAYLYALSLAKTLKTSVRLISIRPNLKDYLHNYENEFNNYIDNLKLLAQENQLSDVIVESSLEIGDILLTILDFIEKENIRYVVMGTNGENSLGKKIFGSETLNVVRNSPVPVLAVPDRVKYKEKRGFAFATMFNDQEDNALSVMLQIVKRYEARLNVVHVEVKSMTNEMLSKKKEWEINHPNLTLDVVRKEDVESALLEYCRTKSVDVLGVVQRDLSTFERFFSTNHTKQLITSADFAILFLHESKI